MSQVTELLQAAEAGDGQAAANLFAIVYDELKRLAMAHMAREGGDNTLQPTALVHEAYLRLLAGPAVSRELNAHPWKGRAQFFAAVAEAMRRILIESARRKKRQKRGGDRVREPLDPDRIAAPDMADDLLSLDEALTRLASVEPQIAQLVKLRYFGGLTNKEAAATLGISPRTADAHWAYARAWLLDVMTRADGEAG